MKYKCPYAETLGCLKSFSSRGSRFYHIKLKQEGIIFFCHLAKRRDLVQHLPPKPPPKIMYRKSIKKSPLSDLGGFPCLYAEDSNCHTKLATQQGAIRYAMSDHDRIILPCPFSKEEGCDQTFIDESNAKRHVTGFRSDERKKDKADVPCPRALDENCSKMFSDTGCAKSHAMKAHSNSSQTNQFQCSLRRGRGLLFLSEP
jgi:hypothetical protein